MGPTALQQHGEGLGATAIAEYRGATTAASFGDPQGEFATLRAGCGVYDLGYRAKIAVTGRDRVRWLNGMITNNIRDLAVSCGVYGFLLNPQGHILGDLYAYNRGESITVDTDSAQLEKILATFDHYIIMDDVELRVLSAPDKAIPGAASDSGMDAATAQEMTTLGIGGPKARDAMRKAGIDVPDLQHLQLREIQFDCDGGRVKCTIVRTDDAIESYEMWLAPAHVRPLWNALIGAEASPVGFEALELRRIVSGIPQYGVDIQERDLPQETEQARALNFSKGCYIGQEIVERIRSRGAVHRKFSGFLSERGEALPPGSKIVSAEKEVGEITSSAVVHTTTGRKTVALGYIRREVSVPGRELLIGGVRAHVVQLPISDNGSAEDPSLSRHSA